MREAAGRGRFKALNKMVDIPQVGRLCILTLRINERASVIFDGVEDNIRDGEAMHMVLDGMLLYGLA